MRAPAVIQPTRSLFALFFLVVLTNLAAMCLHLLDFASGQNGGKGLILDFVGQGECTAPADVTPSMTTAIHNVTSDVHADPTANPASFTRIILLDIAIFLIQLTTLTVSYITNYSPTLPKSEHFPYDDLLLPPAPRPAIADGDLDVESGDQFRQRRNGKGPRYQNVPEGEVWFDEQEDEDDPLLGGEYAHARTIAGYQSTHAEPPAAPPARVFPDVSRSRGRRSAVPLIFDVSPLHFLSLVFRLPNPTPPRLFSGGTPLHTPPATPLPTQESVQNLVNALAEAQARAEAVVAMTSTQRLAANSTSGGSGRTSRGRQQSPPLDGDEESRIGDDGGDGEGSRRIPGDYWTTRATG